MDHVLEKTIAHAVLNGQKQIVLSLFALERMTPALRSAQAMELVYLQTNVSVRVENMMDTIAQSPYVSGRMQLRKWFVLLMEYVYLQMCVTARQITMDWIAQSTIVSE